MACGLRFLSILGAPRERDKGRETKESSLVSIPLSDPDPSLVETELSRLSFLPVHTCRTKGVPGRIWHGACESALVMITGIFPFAFAARFLIWRASGLWP